MVVVREVHVKQANGVGELWESTGAMSAGVCPGGRQEGHAQAVLLDRYCAAEAPRRQKQLARDVPTAHGARRLVPRHHGVDAALAEDVLAQGDDGEAQHIQAAARGTR